MCVGRLWIAETESQTVEADSRLHKLSEKLNEF